MIRSTLELRSFDPVGVPVSVDNELPELSRISLLDLCARRDNESNFRSAKPGS